VPSWHWGIGSYSVDMDKVVDGGEVVVEGDTVAKVEVEAYSVEEAAAEFVQPSAQAQGHLVPWRCCSTGKALDKEDTAEEVEEGTRHEQGRQPQGPQGLPSRQADREKSAVLPVEGRSPLSLPGRSQNQHPVQTCLPPASPVFGAAAHPV